MERLPVERALTDQVKRFKAIAEAGYFEFSGRSRRRPV